LNEGYARGAQLSSGDIIVFSHDDILLVDPDFQARLIDACSGSDIVGVCGTTRVTGPAVAWSGPPYVHGWITHASTDGTYLPSISSLALPRVDAAQALDGVFLATRPDVVAQLGFDATTFDGFHLYDMDFTYRAYLRGLKLRIQSDLLIVHELKGNFSDQYWKYENCSH
jgi:GT2 family glycosyltransferase